MTKEEIAEIKLAETWVGENGFGSDCNNINSVDANREMVNAFLAGVYEDGKTGAFMVRSHGQHRYATIDCSTKYQNCCLNNIARGFI